MTATLLSRDEFRAAVFARDKQTCVNCRKPAQDAHHIIERRLFPDGGYYLDNGASLCGLCHILAEETNLTPAQLREQIGATSVILPPHLYEDQEYDKWGNIILPNGQLMKGELADDPSVRKIMDAHQHRFTNRIKYPRTWHLPWSPGYTSDDRVLPDISGLTDIPLVMTLKMDGEQTTIYSDGYCHARSIDSGSHPSRDWVKRLAGEVGHELPGGWRVCGENLFAQHSIGYKNLEDYFLVFSIWENLRCLSWQETVEWSAMLGLKTVPAVWTGQVRDGDEETIHQQWKLHRRYAGEDHEGYVVRKAADFHYKDFRRVLGKYVRASHVHTHGHWIRQAMVQNGKRQGAE